MNKTGFGFLRLPRTGDGGIDYQTLNPMVDRFLALGGRYFDTAYTYLEGRSEEAIRKAVVERHPRDSFQLADKLPGYEFRTWAECGRCFDEQLRRCGVEWFDVYLLHGLNAENYAIAREHDQFGFLRQLKAEGRAKKIGFSFHDSPQLLNEILTDHPEVDVVLLQINYLDWDSVSLQARALYETAVAHGKTVLVMEPVKGGTLASVPDRVRETLESLRPGESPAAWAIRFAASLEQTAVVLSGMNTMAQVEDNLRDLPPLTEAERAALAECAELIRTDTAVGCTGCGYCLPECPRGIPIPQFFALYNDYARNPGDDWKMQYAYDDLAASHARASDCVGCKGCEKRCPQGIAIAQQMQAVRKAFEENKD